MPAFYALRASLTTRWHFYSSNFRSQELPFYKETSWLQWGEEGKPCRDAARVFLYAFHLVLSHKIAFGKIIIPTTVCGPSILTSQSNTNKTQVLNKSSLICYLQTQGNRWAYVPPFLCNKKKEKGSIPLCGKVEIGISAASCQGLCLSNKARTALSLDHTLHECLFWRAWDAPCLWQTYYRFLSLFL